MNRYPLLICLYSLLFSREQQRLVEIDKRKEEDALKESRMHADDVRKQIREKEQLKIADRRSFFEEGIKMEEEARQRRQRLDEVG